MKARDKKITRASTSEQMYMHGILHKLKANQRHLVAVCVSRLLRSDNGIPVFMKKNEFSIFIEKQKIGKNGRRIMRLN